MHLNKETKANQVSDKNYGRRIILVIIGIWLSFFEDIFNSVYI